MGDTREDLLKSALELSEPDRLLLATELIETIKEDPSEWLFADSELLAELDARSQDGSQRIAWESVLAQLQADLDA